MVKNKFKSDILTLPNAFTFMRIAGALCMIFLTPLSVQFFIVYTICGVSDVLDGVIARATEKVSRFGSKLDSVADMIFYAVMVIRLFPILWKRLPAGIWYTAGWALAIRIACYATAAVKYHCFASQHTYFNKLTGASVFLIPYFANTSAAVAYGFTVCVIAILASSEELIIHIYQSVYNPKVKTILSVKKYERQR